ncbi:MAG TPA: AraC family transcriptional regulator [Woeseiaceae bacterium]|nr:AraC family transcriptional regulator [Woeseiaceae bacterium]
MCKSIRVAVLGTLLCALALEGNAQDISREELKSLDDQVQEIKSDVLGIASELNNLEERLLFPSNTEVSVFIAIAEGEKFRLDAVQLDIDDQLATHHIYSFKELEALQKGGVQRVYTGNVATGAHTINVRMMGKLTSGKDFEFEDRFSFDKGVEPEALGVKLAAPGGGSGIQFGEW